MESIRSVPPSSSSEAETLIRRFTDVWAHPNLENFLALMAPNVRLLQPVTAPVIGRDAARREFSRMFKWLPDLVGTVEHAAHDGNTILISWRLDFTLGGARFVLPIVDRIVFERGLIVEREAYFDSLRFMLATVTRPRAWLGYWRYRGFLPGGDA